MKSILRTGGVFYLLLERENNPEEVMDILEKGLRGNLMVYCSSDK